MNSNAYLTFPHVLITTQAVAPSAQAATHPLNQQQEVCRRYNEGRCRYPRYKYLHICTECSYPHPSHIGGCTVQLSRCGTIPNPQGKWRIITDLSHSLECSANHTINPKLCSLTYTMVEKVAQRVMPLGIGAQMAKVDIEAVYPPLKLEKIQTSLSAWEDCKDCM